MTTPPNERDHPLVRDVLERMSKKTNHTVTYYKRVEENMTADPYLRERARGFRFAWCDGYEAGARELLAEVRP